MPMATSRAQRALASPNQRGPGWEHKPQRLPQTHGGDRAGLGSWGPAIHISVALPRSRDLLEPGVDSVSLQAFSPAQPGCHSWCHQQSAAEASGSQGRRQQPGEGNQGGRVLGGLLGDMGSSQTLEPCSCSCPHDQSYTIISPAVPGLSSRVPPIPALPCHQPRVPLPRSPTASTVSSQPAPEGQGPHSEGHPSPTHLSPQLFLTLHLPVRQDICYYYDPQTGLYYDPNSQVMGQPGRGGVASAPRHLSPPSRPFSHHPSTTMSPRASSTCTGDGRGGI